MWFFYALMGAIITGVGQALVKRGQVALTPLLDNLLAAIIVNIVLAPLLFFRGVDIADRSSILGYALIAATMYATFYYIISVGNVSLMISLINTFPIVTIALAIFCLQEWPSPYQWVGIFLVVAGVIYISRERQEENSRKIKNKKKIWVIWGLLGSLAIGTAEFVTKLATLQTDGFTFTFFVYLMYIPIAIVCMLLDKGGRKFETLKNTSSLLYTLIGILGIEAGLIAIALAFQYGSASLVSPVVATHSLITILIATFFLKEKLQGIQKIGIALNLAGVSMIGIWS